MNRTLPTMALLILMSLVLPVTAATYGPTRDQETLWSIASRLKPTADISVQQVALALYRKNPQAFESANINALKHNVILQTPTLAEIRATSYVQAVRATQQHNTVWQSGGINQPTTTAAKAAISTRLEPVRPRTVVKVIEKPVVVVNNTVRRQQEAEIKRLKQQVNTLSRELAHAKTQTSRLRQQLTATKPVSATPVAVTTASATSNPVTPQQPTPQDIEIARQVQKLSAQVADLESVLAEKNNHITNLRTTLKNASETIKRQHNENLQLVSQLKANTAGENAVSNAAASSAPELKLAEVQVPAPTSATSVDNNTHTDLPATPPENTATSEPSLVIAPSTGNVSTGVMDASGTNEAVITTNPTSDSANSETKPTEGVWAEEPSTSRPNAMMQPTNDVRTTPQRLIQPTNTPVIAGSNNSVAGDVNLATPAEPKPLFGTKGTVPPPSTISYVIGVGALGFIALLWWRSRRDKKLKANDFPIPEQDRRRKTIRQDPVIPFEPKARDSAKSE